MYNGNLRSKSALLFLNVLRNEHPRLQTHFMERFWHDIFVKNLSIDSTNDFLRATLRIQYSLFIFHLGSARIWHSVFFHFRCHFENWAARERFGLWERDRDVNRRTGKQLWIILSTKCHLGYCFSLDQGQHKQSRYELFRDSSLWADRRNHSRSSCYSANRQTQ